MNEAESDLLASSLVKVGYTPSPIIDECDIIIIYSCVVRQSAENRVIAKIKSLEHIKESHPEMIIALAGCIVDSDIISLKHRFPYVDLFTKPGEFSELLKIAENLLDHKTLSTSTPVTTPTAYITIIEGCNNFCSYCVVPYRRGREKSRSITDIYNQIKNLACNGVKEVTLLGQNVDSYGHDLPDKPDLADLLSNLNSIEGIVRIRFLTSHPKDMNQKLIDTVAHLDKVCEYISLPAQSGDDSVLRAMGRGYTAGYFRGLVQRIRETIPNVAISTDVIVGFPGETTDQFQKTLALLSDLRFDTVHVAAYSPRRGTRAATELTDDISSLEKKSRLRKIEELQKQISTEINSAFRGKSVEVLVEGKFKGKWQGRTRNGKLVFFLDRSDWLGHLVNVEIEKTSPWSLQGFVK